MEINLTWDLFIIVFFTLVVSYSFIIGYNKTLKIILASYIAILTADGIGNLVVKTLFDTAPDLNIFLVRPEDPVFIVLKIAIFIVSVVVLSIKGGFEIEHIPGLNAIHKSVHTLVFGAMSGLLLIAVVLVFTSGASFLEGGGIDFRSSNISEMYNTSYLVQLIVLNYNFIFIIPAISFVILSLTSKNEEVE